MHDLKWRIFVRNALLYVCLCLQRRHVRSLVCFLRLCVLDVRYLRIEPRHVDKTAQPFSLEHFRHRRALHTLRVMMVQARRLK